MTDTAAQTAQPARRSLRRTLGLVPVVGIALATMAPSMAANINPQGMGRRVFLQGDRTVPRWQVVIPIVGIVLLVITLASNVIRFPSGVDLWAPAVAAVWIVLGVVIVVRVRRVPETIAGSIAEDRASRAGPG